MRLQLDITRGRYFPQRIAKRPDPKDRKVAELTGRSPAGPPRPPCWWPARPPTGTPRRRRGAPPPPAGPCATRCTTVRHVHKAQRGSSTVARWTKADGQERQATRDTSADRCMTGLQMRTVPWLLLTAAHCLSTNTVLDYIQRGRAALHGKHPHSFCTFLDQGLSQSAAASATGCAYLVIRLQRCEEVGQAAGGLLRRRAHAHHHLHLGVQHGPQLRPYLVRQAVTYGCTARGLRYKYGRWAAGVLRSRSFVAALKGGPEWREQCAHISTRWGAQMAARQYEQVNDSALPCGGREFGPNAGDGGPYLPVRRPGTSAQRRRTCAGGRGRWRQGPGRRGPRPAPGTRLRGDGRKMSVGTKA